MPNPNNEDIKWLYGKLKSKGYNIGSEQEFASSLANDADRKWYYEKAKGMGLNIGSMNDFNSLYAPAKPQPTHHTQAQPVKPQPKVAAPVHSATPQPAKPQQAAPVRQQPVTYFRLRRGGKDFNVSADEVQKAGGLQAWANRHPGAPVRVYMQGNGFDGHVALSEAHNRRVQKGYKYSTTTAKEPVQTVSKPVRKAAPKAVANAMSEAQKARALANAQMMMDNVTATMHQAKEGVKNMRDYQAKAGFGNFGRTVEGAMEYNPATGKMEQTYITPQGEKTRSKAAADMSSEKFRQKEEFFGRMAENGLDPQKQEDVQKQMQLDEEKPMRDVLNDVWGEAEAQDKKAQETWRNRADKNARGFSLSDAAAASNSAGAVFAGRGEDFNNDLEYQKQRHSIFDFDKMANTMYARLPEDYRKSTLARYTDYFKKHPKDAKGKTAAVAAKEALMGELYRQVYDRAKAQSMPKSRLDFLLRKIADQPLISSSMAANTVAAWQTGSHGLDLAEQDAMSVYGSRHKAFNIAGTVANMALDPVTYAAGGVGGVVGKKALQVVGKQALKGATKKVAERYAAGTLAGRVAQGVAGGAANFGTFNTVKGIQQQMAVGGTLDENGKPTNELSAGDILKETAHGLMLGAATGTLSPLIGNVADKAVKATSSTAGKVALRAGQTAVSTLAEGTVFAIPDMVDKGKWDWDTWTDSQAMMLGFKASHAIKSAPRVIDALRTDGKRYGLSFEERLRKQMDASPSDIGFKPEELDELRDKGYVDLSMLFRNANNTKKNAKSTELDRRTDPYENLAPDTFDGYEAMKQLMNDNSVSEATRAKAYYILTGHMLPMSTVTGYTQDRADDGSVVINSVNARGGVVTTRRFANEQAAQQEKDNIMRQAELNSVTVGEKYKETASNMMVMEQAIKDVAPDADVATVLNNYKKVKNGQLTDEAYVKQAQAIDEAIERNRHIADPNRPKAIRENIKKETGIDVDASLRKMPAKRTEKEQAVVDEYVRSLFPEQKRQENESGEQQPTTDEAADADFNNRLEQRQQSYDEGRAAFDTADTEGDRSDSDAIMQRVKEAYEEIDRVFGDEAEMRLAQLEDDPWEVTQDDSLTEEQQDAVAYFINAKAAMDGLTDAANDNAENKRADIDRKVEQHTNKQTGMIHPATLKMDNRPVYIVSGKVVMFPDGSDVDKANSSESVVVCDAETGEVKFISPDMIYNVEEPISADQERQAAYDAIEAEQQAVLGGEEPDVAAVVQQHTGPKDGQGDLPGKGGLGITEPEQTQLTREGIDNAFNAELAQRTGGEHNLQGEGLQEAAAQQSQYIQQAIDDQKQQQAQAEAQRHAAEEKEMAKPLYRIPKDENGTPLLEETDPETAWDGTVEYMDGNVEDAGEYVNGMVNQLTKDVEKAKKAVSKIKPTTDLAAFKQAKAEARQAQADAEARLDKWQQIANVKTAREKAERDRIAAERAEADRKAHDEAVARLAEQKRIEAEKKAEQEAVGTNTVNPKIKARWDEAPKVEGNADMITLPDGSQLRGHYVLTESGAATASHDVNNGYQPTEGFPIDENGQSVNDRDYARDKEAQGLVRSIADSYDNRALQSPVIVSRDGIVLSGNNRTMSGDLAARNNTDASYNDYVREFGQKYGFDAETVNSMKHPRVLFVPDEDLPYDAKTFARFNAQEMKSQSKPEAAVKLGKIVPDKTFSHIVNAISKYDRLPDFYASENEVNTALRELMSAGVINDKQLPELRTGNALSAQGKELLENVLIGKVFQSNPDAVRQIISHPALKQTIVMALGEIASNRTLAAKGYDLSEELGNAVDLVCRAKDAAPDIYREGMPVSPFGRQHGLFDDEYGDSTVKDATTLLLADVLNSSKPSDLRKILATYNNEAVQSANGQLDIFSGRIKTKEELLKEINQRYINATPKEQQALVDAAIEERKRRSAESEQANASETGSGQTAPREHSSNTLEGTGDRSVDEWFGPIYNQFKGKGDEAEAYLREVCEGVAKGALTYPGISPIDIPWGDNKAGYMKIVVKHPEVVGHLQEILNSCKIKSKSDNRIVFENDTHKLIVSKMKGSTPTDNWLLTAYEKKKSVSASSSDIETEPEGKRNGTAAPQNGPSSIGKDNKSSDTEQGKSAENSQKQPYVKENDMRPENMSREGGTSSISHADSSAPAISLESRRDNGTEPALNNGPSTIGKDNKRQAEREDGQLLILPSESEEAGALSSPTNDLSSGGKGTDLFGNEQGSGKKSSSEGKIDDVGEVLAGARKDMRKEITKSLANITEAELVEKPFGKVYKKPDLKKAVESGALREKDAIFYEAFFSMVNQQKPKVTQREMRSKRYNPDYKTKAERWAADTFKQMEVLRQFMELDEPGRDAMIDQMLSDHYPTREQELAEIEKRKGWNPDYEGHKYEWGEMTTPNPLWVTHEVMNRLGYSVGDKLDIPYGVVEANMSGTGYSIENLKGERASLFGSDMTLDEAIDRIVYLAKLKRGDADVSHPTQLFAFPATKSESGESGRYRVMWGRDYKTREFDSKEDADAFAQTKSGAYVSPIMETKRRFGYKVLFIHPLTGEKMFVDDAEFDTKEEAEAYLADNFDKINGLVNDKLQEESEKRGEKKTLTADEVVHATMVRSSSGKWVYAVVIDKKYANNDGEASIIKEGFASRKDAVDYANSIKDEVLKTLLAHKEEGKKVVYFDTGKDSRIGTDYRSGKDVAAEDFMNTFGFRGVQFGNWTNQEDRQMALNQAYDALMDLANVIGVSPQAISLNGELGIAFGSRGSGNANAHYELNNVVINLTKTRGAGSLAHEWWHALDNYFARRVGRPLGMVTDNREIAMRAELREAFNNMLDLVGKSDYARRSRARGEYWGSMHEITARLLSEWIDNELKKRSELNTFLARGANVERWQRHNYKAYESIERIAGREPMSFEDFKERPESLRGIPYPTTKEVEQFGASLRHIFDTIEERVDEKTGMHALLSKVTGEAKPVSEDEAALRDGLSELMREAGLDVIDDVEEGQRVLDMANGRVRQMSFGEPYDYEKYPLGRVEPGISNKEVGVVAASANHGFANYKEAKAWAKENVVKTYNTEETGGKGEVRISNRAVDKFLSQSAVGKSDSKDVHLAVLKVLPDVLKESIDVETHPDFLKGTDGKRSADNGMNRDVLVHRCYGAVSIDGKLYRVKITLKEDVRNKSLPSNTHSYEATKIELLAGTLVKPEGDNPNTNNSISAANLLKNVGLSYNPSEKVLAASEKRAKSIREQRVYHGSGADFDHFDHSHMGEGAQAYGWGTYVTEIKGIGESYAKKSPQASGLKRSELENYIRRAEEQLPFLSGAARMRLENKIKGWKEELNNLKESKLLYTVEIPDDNGRNYLPWERDLGAKEKDSLRKAFTTAVISKMGSSTPSERQDVRSSISSEFKYDITNVNGMYRMMTKYLPDSEVSHFLHDCGYVGISYPAEYRSGGREDGARNYVIFNDKDLKITDKVKFFRTANGEAYGYTVGGKIYIDPRIATSETPIHEYAHLWAEALRKVNPKEWANVVKLMKGTWAWDYVRKQYPELETDDEIAEEALAHFSGKRGAERLRQAAREEADKTDGVIGKAGVWSVFSRIKEALEKFWQGVSDFLHIHFTSADEVADKVMYDLLNKVKPGDANRADVSHGREDVDAANKRFNDELDAYVNHQIPKNDMLHLGMPLGVLSHFLPNLPIVMRQRILTKASVKKHNVDLLALRDMPKMMSHPIFIFQRADNAIGILTEMKDRDGKNVCVAIDLARTIQDGGEMLEVNDIRSIHGREISDIVYPILKNETLRWVDKGKGLAYLSSASRYVQQEIDKQDLSSAAKIVEDFENPVIKDENLSGGEENNPIKDAPTTPSEAEESDIEAVNKRFNKELERYEKGETPVGTRFDLGMPSKELESAGFPYLPISMRASLLSRKAGMERHPFVASDLRGLVKAIQKPIAIFKYSKENMRNLIVDVMHGGKHFLVGVTLDYKAGDIEVNSVSGLFPKESHEWIKWIQDGKTIRIDQKKKVLDLIDSLRTNPAESERIGLNLSSVAKIVENFDNPVIKGENLSTSTEDPNGDSVKYRSVPEGPLLDFLNGQPTRKGFRYAQWANFGVLPPMTAKVDGEWRPPMIFSQWEQSEEGMRKPNGKADLVQGNGRTTGDVAYNPYFHIRTSPLNDQFTAAYDRPELVVVEGEYPVSELTSGYHAPGAKDSVGLMDWHSGSVNGQLSDETKVQTMLSRYFKPLRIVPWGEVADLIMRRVGKQDITFPINAVPPMLRAELAKRGAKFGEISGQVTKKDIPMLEDLRKRINAGEWNAGLDKAQAYLDAYESSPKAKEARVEQLSAELHTPIRVVSDEDEIASLPTRRKRRAKGWFEPSTGEIVVLGPNNVNVADVENTVVHEVVGHYGLRKLVGEERFDEFLDEVRAHAGSKVGKAIDEIEQKLVSAEVDRLRREKEVEVDRPDNRKGVFALAEATVEAEQKRQHYRRVATEEYMADMAGRIGNEGFKKMDQEELTFWGRVKAKVLKFLDRFLQRLHIARSVKLSDKDVAYILYKSWKNLRNGGKPTIVDEAEDELMRSRTHYDEVSEVHGADEAVKKDGMEVVVSNYSPNEREVKRDIKGSTLAYIKKVTMPTDTGTSAHGNQHTEPAGVSSAAKLGNNVESGVKKSEKVGEGVENTGKGAAVVQQRTEPNPTEHVTKESDTSADEGVMFRDGDSVEYTKAQARNLYEERVSRGLYQAQEALQDSMLGLREAMESILKAEGSYNGRIEDVADYENPYLGENRLSSVNQAECAAFARTLFKPMLEEVASLAKTADERARLTDYMMAKHGLERNEVMARRAAEKVARDEFRDELRAAERTAAKDPLDQDAADVLADVRQRMQDRVDELYAENRGRDYAGLTSLTGKDDVADAENEAAQMVSDYEADHDTTNLWDKVNAVTKATLQKTYESGIIGKATYDDISAMYKHYIPLRGFDKKTSDEAYAYLTDKHSAFNAPIKCAKGRKSKADDPFANMEAMAESAIMQGNRNMLVKRKFMRFAQMHPSDLVSISDLWLHYDDAADEWRPVNSGDVKGTERIEEDDTPREVERKMRDFEEVMRQLSENDPDHFKRQKDNPEIPYRVVRDRDLREHQVLVKQGGKDYVLTINGNPRAAQALNGQTNPDNDMSGALGAILHFGEVINRQLSAFYTTRNPDFIVSNFMRDMLYANTMVWVKESPNYAIRFHKNFAKVNPAKMKMLLTKLRKGTLDMNDETEKAFSVFMANGGETGYSNIRDIEQRKNDIRRELKMYNGKLPFRKAWTLFCERLDEYNRAVENCARFAAFITSRQMKRSLGRSILDAKEISVNFNKKGSGAKFMGATGQTKIGNTAAFVSGLGRSGFVFWNAAVQGTTNFGRQFKNHPAKALAAAATMFLLGALVSGIASDDDVDNKSSYYNLPEYVRRSNIVFRLPGMKESWISIPLSVEYRAWYGMGELMMSVISGNEHYTSGELAGQMASQVSQLLPIDFMEGGGGFKAFVPSSVKPFAEVMTNKSWTGMPLYKDTPWNKDMPEWTKAYKSANKQLVGLSKALNEVSGGDAYTSGAIDINPAQVEYLLNGYFGGVSSTIDKLVKTGETALGQREYDPRSFLILNRLVKSGDERTEYRHINNEYFRLKQEHDKLKARLKHYEDDTYNGVFDYAEKINWLNNSPEYQRLEIFEDYSPDINEINNELKEPMNDNERKQLEKELYMLKKELVEESNKTRK